jgi:hypothetical protein
MDYAVICRFVETENMYTLFTKAEQFIVVNKESLMKAQSNEDFIKLIMSKCKLKLRRK